MPVTINGTTSIQTPLGSASAPADGMTITVDSTQQVTAFTMSGNGGTIVGTAVQLIPNQYYQCG